MLPFSKPDFTGGKNEDNFALEIRKRFLFGLDNSQGIADEIFFLFVFLTILDKYKLLTLI